MAPLKIGFKSELDMLKFKNLKKDRESIIKSGFVDNIKYQYKTNEMIEWYHPKKIRVRISQIEKETDDTKSFYFVPVSRNEMPPFQAGQYVTLSVKIGDNTYQRAYSISSSVSDLKAYRLTIKKVPKGIVSNYMFDYAKEGDTFSISGPSGNFVYSSIRDTKDIIAIAGGSGITPIMAMLYQCVNFQKPANITLLYGAKTEKDLILKREIDELVKKNDNLKVIYILSEETRNDYEHGFINKEHFMNLDIENKSIFVCGPRSMYDSLNTIFKDLDIPNKYIRHEAYTDIPDFLGNTEYRLTCKTQDKEIVIPCFENKTLLESMVEGGIQVPIHCTVGVCGFCRSKLLEGKVQTDKSGLREADDHANFIHPCVTYPLSDIILELPF